MVCSYATTTEDMMNSTFERLLGILMIVFGVCWGIIAMGAACIGIFFAWTVLFFPDTAALLVAPFVKSLLVLIGR